MSHKYGQEVDYREQVEPAAICLLKNKVLFGTNSNFPPQIIRFYLEPAAICSETEVEKREERESSADPGLSQNVSSVHQRPHLSCFRFEIKKF